MSTNIDTFKTEEVDLILPVGFKIEEFIKEHSSYQPDEGIVVTSDLKFWSFRKDWEGLSLEGVVVPNGLKVTKLNCTGVGSGHDFDDVLKPLFTEFHGNLKAGVIWESGEIVRVSIVQGKYTEEEVKL